MNPLKRWLRRVRPRQSAAPELATQGDCYFQHKSAPADLFPCIDGANLVCARCCTESCIPRTPQWFARCSAAGHPTWPKAVWDMSANLPVSARRKIVCLETYWGNHNARLFQDMSVRPFLEALSTQLHPEILIAHRFVESIAQLSYYMSYPDGLCWRDRDVLDAPVIYLSFHGSPGALIGSLESVDADTLCKSFSGWGGKHANLVHFGACSVFEGEAGEAFARTFLAASGCRAITGYATDIDWMDSMVTDLLFVRRFFEDPDPWRNLRAIHESVLADFEPARRLGYRLYMP
ncbi:MAG TPA: hypothetical protein VED01_01755 [Burkholderiales bacterium]|nr:hypothetical protein [Burkholderiales bacterium]